MSAQARMLFLELVLMLLGPVAVWLWLDAFIKRQERERKDLDQPREQ